MPTRPGREGALPLERSLPVAQRGLGLKLSILVPVFNERSRVEELVQRVLHAPLPPGWMREVLLIDDGSTDGTSELLDALDAQARQTAQREHCLNYLWDNAARFRLGTFNPTEPWLQRPDLKLDVDQPQDFQRLALLPLHPDMDARAIVDACDGER